MCNMSAGHVTVQHYFRCMSRRCVCVVKVSAPNLSVLEPVCFQPLNTYRVCLYICLCAFWTSAYRSISPCICLPPPPARLLWAFQPVCLGLLLAGDKRASWQPEAICHPGPFCSAPVRCLLQVWIVPWGPHIKKDFLCWSTVTQDES